MTAPTTDDRARQALLGGGEMGERIRAFDWSATPLGPVDSWPHSLRITVALLLSTRHPMFIWWGPELIQFYNDAYSRSLGPDRHPSALGQRGRECWAEIWPVIGAEVESVMAGGDATWHEDHLVPITRGRHVQDVYWSYSYSPILHDEGGVGGVLVTVQETTRRVVTERRARLLQELAARALQTETEAEVMEAAAAVLEAHPEDVPFALLYLAGPGGDVLQLAWSVGLPTGHRAAQPTLELTAGAPLPVAQALRGQTPLLVDTAGLGQIRREPAPDPVRQALVVPLVAGLHLPGAAGLLVAGLNPRLAPDEDTQTFLEQVGREITHGLERARAESQVRRAWRAAELAATERDLERRQLARIFELSPTFLAVLRGPELVFELTNSAYQRLIGDRPVIGKRVRDAIPEVEDQGFFELLEEVYRTGVPFVGNELPLAMRRAPEAALETRYINFVYQPMHGPVGEANGVLVSGTDVTDLVQSRGAAERLAVERDAERRQLFTVLEQSPAAIILADAASGRVTFVNERVRQIFGPIVAPDAIESYAHRWRSVDPVGRPVASEDWPLTRALRRGEVVAYETVVIEDASGRRTELVANAAPVRDAQGDVIAAVLMCWDVTAERRTERRLRDAERLQSVGTLAGGVAHEVNNQMTTVLGFGEFILRALGPEHPEAADLRVVLTAAERTARITHQLLTFSRKQVTQPRVVDLHTLAVGLGPVLRQLLGPDKALVISGAKDACRVTVDPTQVEQVLINLVGNARDATETGATITIGVENAEIGPSGTGEGEGAPAPGRYVLMTVSDTGRGMDPVTLARAFEPFFTTKEVGEGTGLGLSMVYGIVKRHGGFVWGESAPEQGTTMRIYWPANAESMAAEPADPEDRTAPGALAGTEAAATVLVVEDEPAVRELVTRILRSEGYEVIAAEDGAEALEMLDGNPVRLDLVLTDVLMPRLNGRQLVDALQARYPQLPVLYMSGDIGEAIVARQLVPEGAPFLRKPFSPSQLMDQVAAVLA